MQPMNASQPAQGQPLTRKEFRRIMNAVSRANAPGRDERVAAAQTKRDRRNVKRAEDAGLSAQGVVWAKINSRASEI